MQKRVIGALMLSFLASSPALMRADSFSISTFATGSAVGATSPDSVVYGDNSLWVSYTNGAASDGSSGSSTVVQYSVQGAVQNTWKVSGNVDGLRVAPDGTIWAMQNNDGNSALTLINPVTKTTTALSYGSSYTANGNAAGRGFDDVQFLNGQIFLSETNPAAGTDPVVLKLTSGVGSPLQVAGILSSSVTGTSLATGKPGSVSIGDPDSLALTPGGDLILTGEADKTIVWIHNPGAANQSASYLKLNGVPGSPDDTVFNSSHQGVFFVEDSGANKIYEISASLAANDAFVSVGSEFGVLNTATGTVSAILTGTSFHGAVFVPASAIPEPASYAVMLGGLLAMSAMLVRGRRS